MIFYPLTTETWLYLSTALDLEQVGGAIYCCPLQDTYTFQQKVGAHVMVTQTTLSSTVIKQQWIHSFIQQVSEDLQDGRGVRPGDHLPPHKYIKNTSTCGTTPTEHLLNAGRGSHTSQKARNSPYTWPCGWQGLRAPARCQAWASEVGEPLQDIGPPENSQPLRISISKSSPEISFSMLRPSSTQRPASCSAGHPMPNN